MDRIILEDGINVFKVPRHEGLRRAIEKFPALDKFLSRLPHRCVEALYRDEFMVMERIFEKGFVFRHLHDVPIGARLLDVGCNRSSLLLEFACLGYEAYGIDISGYAFSHPRLRFFKGSICGDVFESGYFDAVTAVSTLEHIGLGAYGSSRRESDAMAISGIRKILKKGGKLILTLPYGVRTVTDLLRVYDKAALAELIAGFEVEDAQYRVNSGDKYWTLAPEEEAARSGVNVRGRNLGNVCLALVKP